LVFKASK